MTLPFKLAAFAEMLWLDRPIDWRAARLREMGFDVGLWYWQPHDHDKLLGTGATLTFVNGYLRGRLTDDEGRRRADRHGTRDRPWMQEARHPAMQPARHRSERQRFAGSAGGEGDGRHVAEGARHAAADLRSGRGGGRDLHAREPQFGG